METCKNCGQEFEGNYCNNCGQKRIDRHGFYEFKNYVADAFELRRGFPKTIRDLLHKPAVVVKDYIGGKTKIYQNPVSLLLTLIAFDLILNTITQEDIVPEIQIYFGMFLITLSNTVMLKWFFNKSGLNFYERLIFSLYMVSVLSLLSTVVSVFELMFEIESNTGIIILIIWVLITMRFCVPFFKKYKFVWIKSLLIGPSVFSLVVLIATIGILIKDYLL